MEQQTGFVHAVAKLKGCGMSARKMRLVADIIREVPVEKALGILKYTRKEGAIWLSKLLTSAIANWRVKTGEEPEEFGLNLSSIWVDQAPALKRFRPAPHGRAHRIRKHYCHVTLQVTNSKAIENTNKETADAVELADETTATLG
jgi:large subunit ribosomal protein L22